MSHLGRSIPVGRRQGYPPQTPPQVVLHRKAGNSATVLDGLRGESAIAEHSRSRLSF